MATRTYANCGVQSIASTEKSEFSARRLLKRDALGAIYLANSGPEAVVERVFDEAGFGYRWLARSLARREARTLRQLASISAVPRLIAQREHCLVRSYIPGLPMHLHGPLSRAYFRQALRLLRLMHRAGVAHNDLAKEANWLCTKESTPALIDFQLAFSSKRRGRLFRVLAREDLRHLLKHKRTYQPAALSARQRALLQRPSWMAQCWRLFVKPIYVFSTRRILGWPERSGAEERQTLGHR